MPRSNMYLVTMTTKPAGLLTCCMEPFDEHVHHLGQTNKAGGQCSCPRLHISSQTQKPVWRDGWRSQVYATLQWVFNTFAISNSSQLRFTVQRSLQYQAPEQHLLQRRVSCIHQILHPPPTIYGKKHRIYTPCTATRLAPLV